VAEIATKPQKYIHNLPYPVTPEEVVDALVAVEAASIRARNAPVLLTPADRSAEGEAP